MGDTARIIDKTTRRILPTTDDANDDTGEDDSTGNPIQGDPGEPDDNLPEGGAGADLPRSPDSGNNSGNALRAPP